MEGCITKPKTIARTLNTILICWENVSNNQDNTIFILQIENFLREWKTVYWGAKTKFLVDNLQPSTYYCFRLKINRSEWINFKSGTDGIPYSVMHFTRALKFGKTPVIRQIITKRYNLLETGNREGKMPLIQAIENGNLQMVTFLVNLGANINMPTLITQRTPLMVALFRDNVRISSFLLDRGADISSTDCNSLTGLHHAVDSGYLKNVQLCLNCNNFNIDAQDNKGWTPLLRAVIMECSDEIISLLLTKGANPAIKDGNGLDFYKHIKLSNKEYLQHSISMVKRTNENQTSSDDFKNRDLKN